MSSGGFAGLIKDANEAFAGTIIIGAYAIIQKYDKDKMLADVQPLIKEKRPDGKLINYPKLVNVPVAHFGSGDIIIRPDFKKGDLVQLTFSNFDRNTALAGSAASANGKRFGLENATITGTMLQSTEALPESMIGKDGLLIGHKSGNALQQVLSDKIVFHFGEAKTIIDANGITTSGDLIADSERVPLGFIAHGHSTPMGPTIGKIPGGEA